MIGDPVVMFVFGRNFIAAFARMPYSDVQDQLRGSNFHQATGFNGFPDESMTVRPCCPF